MRFEAPYWWQDIVDRILEAISPRCEHCQKSNKLTGMTPFPFEYFCKEYSHFVMGPKKKCSKFISWRVK